MRLFSAMDTSASGLTAQRLRLDLIAANLANANTTRTEQGGPYRRQVAILTPRGGPNLFSGFLGAAQGQQGGGGSGQAGGAAAGVRVVAVVEDQTPPKLKYDPSHPDADENGYVRLPNVNVVTEMVDMMEATRAYEANVTAINAAKTMALRALDIGRA
ncbi:MAG: flagellar basal body rod protein FlgC [Bacillota bacterium]